MAAMRCSVCGINFPLNVKRCRKCGQPLWLNNGSEGSAEPDEDQYSGSPADDSMKMAGNWATPTIAAPPLMQQQRLVEYAGQCWISDDALIDGGYTWTVREGTVIRFYPRNGNGEADAIWFELAGRARHNRLGELNGWWLQRLPTPEEMFRDLPVTVGTDDDGRPT